MAFRKNVIPNMYNVAIIMILFPVEIMQYMQQKGVGYIAVVPNLQILQSKNDRNLLNKVRISKANIFKINVFNLHCNIFPLHFHKIYINLFILLI